ncbi:MAG: SPOR domain-containing protein [Chitinophagales bacterium]
MKKINKTFLTILIYITTLFCTKSLIAQNTSKVDVYKIQLGAFQKVEISKFAALNDLGTLETEEVNKTLKRLIIGSYPTNKDAATILQEIKKRGYKNAFVVHTVIEKIAAEETEKYVVQLGAFKKIEFKNFGDITDLGQLFVESSHNLIKASLGVYTGRERTEKVLKVLKKRGYKNAFIKEARTLLEK